MRGAAACCCQRRRHDGGPPCSSLRGRQVMQRGRTRLIRRGFMPLYEHIYLVRQDITVQQAEELTSQYRNVIEQNGGKIAKTEYWGVKSLTYRIRKNRKAHFTLMNVDAPPAALAEIERLQRLNEDVLRYLTIRV